MKTSESNLILLQGKIEAYQKSKEYHEKQIEDTLMNYIIIPFCQKYNVMYCTGIGTNFFMGVYGRRRIIDSDKIIETNHYSHELCIKTKFWQEFKTVWEQIEKTEELLETGVGVEYNPLFVKKNTPIKMR